MKMICVFEKEHWAFSFKNICLYQRNFMQCGVYPFDHVERYW